MILSPFTSSSLKSYLTFRTLACNPCVMFTMILSVSLASIGLLSNLYTTPALSRPQSSKEVREIFNTTTHVLCPETTGYQFCQRCADRNIRDMKRCISTELSQKEPDGRHRYESGGTVTTVDGADFYQPGGRWGVTTADALFSVNGTQFQLSINIDSCRRVDSNTHVGPLNVRNKKFTDVTV